jgi:type II secretory pathway pseudopilin PulG
MMSGANYQPRRCGAMLIELVISISIVSAVFAIIVFGLVMVSRVSALESKNAVFTSRSQNALDTMRQDAISSSNVLSTYTVGSTTYTSSPTGVLILQSPTATYNANGSVAATYYDTIIYHLVGTAAPYTINRRLIPANGSPTSALSDTVLVSNVSSFSINFLHHVSWTANGSTMTFPLDVPRYSAYSTATTINQGGSSVTSGVSWNSSSTQYPQGSVLFTTEPANGTVIDAFYPVDSTTSLGQAGVSMLSFDMTVSGSVYAPGASTTQSFELSSVAKLRNN